MSETAKPWDRCERCNRPFDASESRFACAYECTYCAGCTGDLAGTCANCGGALREVTRQ